MKQWFGVVVAVLLSASRVYADVQITEIAWMGTSASQYSEWFELYNDAAESVNLAGWKLVQGDGSVIFTMTKSIGGGEYLLVERTTASAPDAVPGIDDESGPFGASGFANTGEDLVLKDASGTAVQTLSYASGWPAGDASTKQTMQWDGSSWITADPTPKAATDGSGMSSNETDVAQKDEEKDPYPIPPTSPNKPHIEFTIPKPIYVGVPYEYKARPVFEYNYTLTEGDFTWNMGEGTIYTQRTYAPLMHTYRYPGTYTISFRYRDPAKSEITLVGSQKVSVVAPTIALSLKDSRAVELKNTASTAVDISGWMLRGVGYNITIPDMTVLAERATITIPLGGFGVSYATSASLVDPSGTVVATTAPAMVAQTTTLPVVLDDTVVPEYEAPIPRTDTPIRKHTKVIIFGVIALFVIGLSILLERFMARQEYQQEKG